MLRQRRRRRLRGRLRRAVCLVEQLSPRTDDIDRWAEELKNLCRGMAPLAGEASGDRRQASELRERMLQVQATPEELAELVQLQQRRRERYQDLRRRMASQTEAAGLAAVSEAFAEQAQAAAEQADQIRDLLAHSGGRAPAPQVEAISARRKRSRQR